MKRHAIVLPGAALLAVALLAAANAAQAQGTLKPVEARIVNTPAQPVPVTVLSAPVAAGEGSREIYSMVLNVLASSSNFACTTTQVVPDGKRLVVQHLGARVVQIGTVNALLYVGMGSGHGEPLDLLVPAAAPLRGGSDDSFIRSAAGQQVHAYFDNRYVVCLETMTAMTRDASVQVRGYLVPKP